jgi:transposase
VKQKREQWFGQLGDTPVKDLIFLDEFAATTNMTRTHARGPRGQRVVCKVPHGHWKVLSTVAVMTVQGIVNAVVYDGPVNTEAFVGFAEQFLAPMLRPGQVVVLDNLPAHRSSAVDQAVEAVGAKVLRLPPYSPEFNPIEMAISKVKGALRKEGARTVDRLFDAIGPALSSVTADDAANYIRHCGYAATRD